MTGQQTSRQATRQRTRKPSSQRGQVRGRLGNRNRKRNRRHGPINALKRSWRKANWPTRIKMVLIPTVAVVVVVALVAGLVRFTNWRAQVRAAEAAQLELTRTYDFNPGNIISDGQFFNGSAMSQAEVQSFLDTQGGSLAAMTFDTSNESGEGLCADYTGTKGESAATIIDQSARACKVSQKVLLTVMQKEQHLVTAVDPSDYQLMAAMGLNCPVPPTAIPPMPDSFGRCMARPSGTVTISSTRNSTGIRRTISTTSNIIRTRHAAAHKCISRTRRPPCSTSIRPTSRTSPHWPLATVPAIPAPVMATATSRLSTPAGSVRREADNGS